MAIDIVKPLKLENGDAIDLLPTETNPTEDFLAAKGIAFEGNATSLLGLVGSTLRYKDLDHSIEVEYLNGLVSKVTVFKMSTQKTMEHLITYSSGLPASETIRLYLNDGSTIGETITRVFSYNSQALLESVDVVQV
jgi:hypothetical protein